jgi:hypothetical protein
MTVWVRVRLAGLRSCLQPQPQCRTVRDSDPYNPWYRPEPDSPLRKTAISVPQIISPAPGRTGGREGSYCERVCSRVVCGARSAKSQPTPPKQPVRLQSPEARNSNGSQVSNPKSQISDLKSQISDLRSQIYSLRYKTSNLETVATLPGNSA